MGGRPSPPPQPPDHSGKRARFASQQSAARTQQADQYNQAVNDWNQQLGGFSGQIGDLGGRISGLGLGDMDKIGAKQDEISDLSRNLRSLHFGEVRPQFDSMVHSPWGAVSVNTPGLQSINTSQRDSALMELQDLQRQLGGLQNEYRGHERDLTNFKSDMYGQLVGLNSSVGRADIGQDNFLNSQRSQLDQMRAQLAAHDNPVAGYSDQTERWLGRINPMFDSIDARFADLDQRRDAEQGRISGFADQIYGQLGGIGDQLGNMTIADQDGMRDIERQLRDVQRQKAGFSSALDFDFGRERALGQDLTSQLQQLTQDRQSEQGRVDQYRRDAMDQSNFLSSQARMGNVFDGDNIQGLMDQIAMLRDEKSMFESPLEANFGASNRMLDSAEQRLSQLMDARGQHLGRFSSQLDDIRDQFGQIDPNNEQGLQQAMSRAQSLANQLGRFSGQDTMDLNFQVQDKIQAIDTSLRDLVNQRQQLQQQAQQMLNQVSETQYLDNDMVTGAKDEVRAMREQAQLMNAQQALQEIDRIMQHLTGEKQRLSHDAQNVANAQSMAQREVTGAMGPGGVPQFPNTPMIEGMTPEQYLALLQRTPDDQYSQSAPAHTSTFSASLGI